HAVLVVDRAEHDRREDGVDAGVVEGQPFSTSGYDLRRPTEPGRRTAQGSTPRPRRLEPDPAIGTAQGREVRALSCADLEHRTGERADQLSLQRVVGGLRTDRRGTDVVHASSLPAPSAPPLFGSDSKPTPVSTNCAGT